MFQRIHRDTYSVIVGILVLAGAITWILAALNQMK
jgi:hypothetical protein